jgi:hypothetical protein
MATYDVAHIREQGADLIVVRAESSLRYKTPAARQEIRSFLQQCAEAAGLTGTVVPVWDNGRGRMAFIAPRRWHLFFSSIDLSFVARRINRRLSCE